MEIKRIAFGQALVLLYLTSENLLNFATSTILWTVAALLIFNDRLKFTVEQVSERLQGFLEKLKERVNTYFKDFSIARIVKTLVVLKALIFLAWLVPGWFLFILAVQLWTFKAQFRPYRIQIKEQIKSIGQTLESKVSGLVRAIPKYYRTSL